MEKNNVTIEDLCFSFSYGKLYTLRRRLRNKHKQLFKIFPRMGVKFTRVVGATQVSSSKTLTWLWCAWCVTGWPCSEAVRRYSLIHRGHLSLFHVRFYACAEYMYLCGITCICETHVSSKLCQRKLVKSDTCDSILVRFI